MVSTLTRRITRDKLAKIFKSHEAIKLIEDLTIDVGLTIPESIVSNSGGIEDALNLAKLALALAGQAMLLAAESENCDGGMSIPGPKGDKGDAGQPAPVLFMLSDDPIDPEILLQPSTPEVVPGGTSLLTAVSALTNGAGAAAGTLLNSPAAGNPTKWISINDGGTIRKIPSW